MSPEQPVLEEGIPAPGRGLEQDGVSGLSQPNPVYHSVTLRLIRW